MKLHGSTLAAEAQKLIGCPYHFGGRSKLGGIDCAGVWVMSCQALGLPVQDLPCVPEGQDLWEQVTALAEADCDLVDTGCNPETWEPGDLILFRGRLMHQHMGVLVSSSPLEMVHGYQSASKIVQQPLDESWLSRVARVYRHRGLA